MQAPVRIDEGNPCDPVRDSTGEEASSGTDLYEPRRGQEPRRGTTAGAAGAVATNRPEKARVVLLQSDEVDRGMTTEACCSRNPPACDDGSVSAQEQRPERSRHGVGCSGRALEGPELPGRCSAACRPDRHAGGDDESCES